MIVCTSKVMVFSICLLFFKQKTAYEVRISDWSSDVCSSDLGQSGNIARLGQARGLALPGTMRDGHRWKQHPRLNRRQAEVVSPSTVARQDSPSARPPASPLKAANRG